MIQVWIPGTAYMAMSYDDAAMRAEVGVEELGTRKRGKGIQVLMAGPESAMRTMLRDAEYRGHGSEFDQPSSWAPACRRAAKSIREALGLR